MKKILEKIINNPAVIETFDYLSQRWADEGHYEDWKEYETAMQKVVEKAHPVTFIKGTKRPFGCKITINKAKAHVFLKQKGHGIMLVGS